MHWFIVERLPQLAASLLIRYTELSRPSRPPGGPGQAAPGGMTMSIDVASKRATFRRLHESGHFVLPNPWDIGGIRRLEKLGYAALASTSAGYAWSLGREDGQLTLEETLAHLRMLCAATDLPVNADFEGGYARQPGGVAVNVARAVATGVAGLSIEDLDGDSLFPLELAVERIRAARMAIDDTAPDVMLVGRSEGYRIGQKDLQDTIRRLVAYAEAGADVLYAPLLDDIDEIRAVVAAVAPKPLNVLLSYPGMKAPMNVPELAAAGVRRSSVGGGLARYAATAFERAALTLRDTGYLPEVSR